MKSGLVYCVRNPAFAHLVKIGKTEKETVEERGLNDTNVPDNFKTIFAIKVSDIDAVEKSVFNALETLRYTNSDGRRTEFFYLPAIEKAKKIIEPFKIKDETENQTEIEPDETVYNEPDPSLNDFVSWEDIRLMMPDDSPFKTEKNAKEGWKQAINWKRVSIVGLAKKLGKWKDKKISKSWLIESGNLDELKKIEWDYSK